MSSGTSLCSVVSERISVLDRLDREIMLISIRCQGQKSKNAGTRLPVDFFAGVSVLVSLSIPKVESKYFFT